MLKFRLVEETPKKVVYEYFPEGGTDAGIVSFNKETKTNSIVTLSTKDKHQRYAQKLFSRIRELATQNSFTKEGMIAWF
jgi:putative aminopeptidase FrvX